MGMLVKFAMLCTLRACVNSDKPLETAYANEVYFCTYLNKLLLMDTQGFSTMRGRKADLSALE